VAGLSDSQGVNQCMAHIEPGMGHQHVRRIYRPAQGLLTQPPPPEVNHGKRVDIHRSLELSQTNRQWKVSNQGTGRGRHVQQALQLLTQGEDGDQETCSDHKSEVAGYHVLQTTVHACTHWSLPKTVRPTRERQMLVVPWWRQDGSQDAGTHLPPRQRLERPAKDTMEGTVKGDGLENGQMQTRADH
jgi:hypothetical protein